MIYILINGLVPAEGRAMSEALIKKLSEKRVACWHQPMDTAVKDMCKVVHIIGSTYGVTSSDPEEGDAALLQSLFDWGIGKDPLFWAKAAKHKLLPLEEVWAKDNMVKVIVIDGIRTHTEREFFKPAITVSVGPGSGLGQPDVFSGAGAKSLDENSDKVLEIFEERLKKGFHHET